MKDKITRFMEKIPVAILFIAMLGYQGWDWYTFTNADESPLQAKKMELATIAREVPVIKRKLVTLEAFRKQIEVKREGLRALVQKLDTLRATISDTFDDAAFIRSASTEAERTRLDVRSINPMGTSQNGDYYVEHKFDVKIKGVYFQILLFLQRITSMQSLVSVENLSIKPSGQKIQKYAQLEASMVIKGYHYVRSKADDIVQKGKEAK